MEDRHEPETGKETRQVRSAKGALMFRVLGIGVVLYWLYGLISAYCKGGPDAPSLTVLLAGIVLLGGGAILVSILTWKAWKIEQASVTKEDDTDENA